MNWANARYAAKSSISGHPALFFFVQRLLGQNCDLRITRSTEIVIEGFPRSANSYATVALQLHHPGPLRIAHHLHVPAQVLRAVRYRIPCLVLIRSPLEALKSFRLAHPHVALESAAKHYRRFYETIAPFRDHYVIGEFSEVTVDFNRTIARLNHKFGTSFAMLLGTDAERQEITHRLEGENLKWNRGDPAFITYPTGWKDRRKQMLEIDPAAPAVAACIGVYEGFMGLLKNESPQ